MLDKQGAWWHEWLKKNNVESSGNVCVCIIFDIHFHPEMFL